MGDAIILSLVYCGIYLFILFRNSQFHMQYKRNIKDKRVQYEI